MSETYQQWAQHSSPVEPEPSPVPAFNAPTSIPITEQNKMTDLEDVDMIRSLVSRIGDYLVERTKLAQQVRELEGTVNYLRSEIGELNKDLETERQSRTETERKLNEVQGSLDHERSTVSQLVAERDQVRDTLRGTEESLANVRKDVEFWQGEASRLERERNEATHSADVCREQREQMAGQVSALRAAFGALRVLE